MYDVFTQFTVPVIFHADYQVLCDLDLDALLVLGGGVPLEKNTPPKWVQKRAEAAYDVYKCQQDKPMIVTLSAGTAHVPQLIGTDGLPGSYVLYVRVVILCSV